MIEVSVVVPVLNEEKYIEDCINSIVKQDYVKEQLEVLFVDGLSTDGTRKMLKKAEEQYGWIRILDNDKKLIPSAMNIGILAAKGIYIVRMDAHTEYSTDYISKCIDVIKNTNADNVGGPVLAKGKTRKQRIIAAAYYSPFALGAGNQYKENFEGYVDTVFLGCYKKELAENIGLYDETMARNEDDEFNYRIVKQGGKIYMSPEIRTVYYPRSSFVSLARQYFGYGEGKPKVLHKHGKPTRLRQVIPMLFVVFLVLGAIGSVLSRYVQIWYCSILMLYLFFDLGFSLKNRKLDNMTDKIVLVWTHIVIHVSYGCGYIKGLIVG